MILSHDEEALPVNGQHAPPFCTIHMEALAFDAVAYTASWPLMTHV